MVQDQHGESIQGQSGEEQENPAPNPHDGDEKIAIEKTSKSVKEDLEKISNLKNTPELKTDQNKVLAHEIKSQKNLVVQDQHGESI